MAQLKTTSSSSFKRVVAVHC